MSSSTSKEQVAPAFCIKGAECEANEHHRGSQEGCDDDAEGNKAFVLNTLRISQTEQLLADVLH